MRGGELISETENALRGIRGAPSGAPLEVIPGGFAELDGGLLAPAWHKWDSITTNKGLADHALLVRPANVLNTQKYLGLDVRPKARVWCLLDETGKVVERGKAADCARPYRLAQTTDTRRRGACWTGGGASPPIRPWYRQRKHASFADVLRAAQRTLDGDDVLDPACAYDNLRSPAAMRLDRGSTKTPRRYEI